MLILARRIGEVLRIGEHISITVLQVTGGQVRLGISAPRSVGIHREEIFQRIEIERQSAAAATPTAPPVAKAMLTGEEVPTKITRRRSTSV